MTSQEKENPMNQTITWTASTVAEAQDILDAVKDRLESGMKAAHPGTDGYNRTKHSRSTPITLSITFDPSALDQLGNERSLVDAQVNDTP